MRGDATLAFEVDSRLRKSNSGATRRWRTRSLEIMEGIGRGAGVMRGQTKGAAE